MKTNFRELTFNIKIISSDKIQQIFKFALLHINRKLIWYVKCQILRNVPGGMASLNFSVFACKISISA